MTETKRPPCVWCDADNMDTHASFNGKDICVDCEENATEITEDSEDTKLSWTDADLEDACYHAKDGGIDTGIELIMHHVKSVMADLLATRMEHRADSKRHKEITAQYIAVRSIYDRAQHVTKVNSYECNCAKDDA